MRRLNYEINLEHFKSIKKEIVPTIFTQHQFKLIEKRLTGRRMTQSEKNEFSRTVSRKMKAINKILERETDIFIYGKEKIKQARIKKAIVYLKKLERKFKNNYIFISGSFLYSSKFNDIDVFVISKYDKEDYKLGKFHINYLTEDMYNSLFFESLRKLCISNMEMAKKEIKEKVSLDTLISLYQEVFNDLDKGFEGIKKTLREFLLQAAFIERMPIPDSKELKQQVSSVLKLKNPKEAIKKVFIKSVIMGIQPKKAVKAMNIMIESYKDLMREYKQHKTYYLDLISSFKEVISIES